MLESWSGGGKLPIIPLLHDYNTPSLHHLFKVCHSNFTFFAVGLEHFQVVGHVDQSDLFGDQRDHIHVGGHRADHARERGVAGMSLSLAVNYQIILFKT